jgi:hypothetical protein
VVSLVDRVAVLTLMAVRQHLAAQETHLPLALVKVMRVATIIQLEHIKIVLLAVVAVLVQLVQMAQQVQAAMEGTERHLLSLEHLLLMAVVVEEGLTGEHQVLAQELLALEVLAVAVLVE